MPEWWLEALLPSLVFGTLLVVWIVLPPRPDESDLGSKIRKILWRRESNEDGSSQQITETGESEVHPSDQREDQPEP